MPAAWRLRRAAVPAQIAKPSPSGGRINIQARRVQCAPPSDLEVSVNNNDGNDGWIRLQIQVRRSFVSFVRLAQLPCAMMTHIRRTVIQFRSCSS